MNDVPKDLAQAFINEQQRNDLEKALGEIAAAESAQETAHHRTMSALSAARNLLKRVLESESEQSEYERTRFKLWEDLKELCADTKYGHSTGWKDIEDVCSYIEEFKPFLQFLRELERTGCSDEAIKKVPSQLKWLHAQNFKRGRDMWDVTYTLRSNMQTISALLSEDSPIQ